MAISTEEHRSGPAEPPGRHARRRWRWLLPTAVVLVWLLGGGPLGSFAGRLAEVVENDNAAFLPASAESTRAADLQLLFVDSETLPAVVVWEADGQVTPALQADAQAALDEVAALDGVVTPVSPPVPSEDGQALQAVVPLDGSLGEGLVDVVEQVREIVGDPPDGAAYVTGPGGQLADLFEAFAGIDGILLATALAVVLVILLVVYRSPVLPLLVLMSALLALGLASAVVYGLADGDVITLNGQSQGILFILVVGAATDYALLLVARFREELREHESRFDAMRMALRQSVEPVVASGATVILGVLCLLLSDLNSLRGLGPVAALGIAAALGASLTFLPAALVLLGRAAFWPFRPRYGSEHGEVHGVWGRVARGVGRRPRAVWVSTALVLAAAAALAPTLDADGVAQSDVFLTEVESVAGQEALGRHFPGGSGTPATVLAPEADLAAVLDVTAGTEGVAAAAPVPADRADPSGPPRVEQGLVAVDATLTDAGDSEAATMTVQRLRAALDAVGEDVLVGGPTAQLLDTQETAIRDREVIIPVVLVVITAVLALLLRSLVAPVLLIATVALSFAATLGVAAVVFDLAGSPGTDPSTPLLGFIFLVALGIDYNIFLMTRVREESWRIGTRPGIVRGLAVTGGVITSAGLVLAATFSALGVLPLLFLAQIAFVVAFGVLLDTFVVRSLLVPALGHDIGPRIWWPSRLARDPAEPST